MKQASLDPSKGGAKLYRYHTETLAVLLQTLCVTVFALCKNSIPFFHIGKDPKSS